MFQMENNLNNIFKLIEKQLGEECIWSKYSKPLPILFRENFQLFNCVTPTQKFIFAVPRTSIIPFNYIQGLVTMLGNDVRFFISNSHLQMMASIYRISYYDAYGRLCRGFNAQSPVEFSYTKATQLVAKYLLFSKEDNYSTRQIADFFNISHTTVRRAYDFLMSIGCVQRTGGFTSSATYTFLSKKKLFDAIKEHLINPIVAVLTVFITEEDKTKLNGRFLLGAETTLYNNTDLDYSNLIEYAVDKETYEYFLNNSSKYLSLNGEMVNIEKWAYNPFYFSKDGCIDTFDAYIILSNRYKKSKDPRIEKGLKQLERMVINGEN